MTGRRQLTRLSTARRLAIASGMPERALDVYVRPRRYDMRHRSMHDELKSIWADMLASWTKNLEEMVLKSSVLGKLNGMMFPGMAQGGSGGAAGGISGGSGLGGVFSGLPGGLGGSSAPIAANAASAGASQYGLLGAFLGPSGAQSTINSLPTNQGATGLLLGPGAAQDVQSGIAGYGQDTTAGSIPAGAGGAHQSATGTGTVTASGLSGLLAGAGEGAAIGGVTSSLTGGNSTYGSLAGILGGVIGTAAHANPLIGAGIDVATSLIGSLLGPKVNAYTQPDTQDTQRYGTTIADLLGHAGANGTTFYENSSTKSLFGGQTALAGVEELLAQGQSNFTTATGLSGAQFAQAVADFGSSATGAGALGFGKNIGDLHVSGASGAGGTFRYDTGGALLAAIETGLGGERRLGRDPDILALAHVRRPERDHAREHRHLHPDRAGAWRRRDEHASGRDDQSPGRDDRRAGRARGRGARHRDRARAAQHGPAPRRLHAVALALQRRLVIMDHSERHVPRLTATSDALEYRPGRMKALC